MNFIVNETKQKLRGGYYTPLDLAAYITRWALEKRPKPYSSPVAVMASLCKHFRRLVSQRHSRLRGLRFRKRRQAKRKIAAEACLG